MTDDSKELPPHCSGVPELIRILKNLEDLKETPRSGEVRAGIPLGAADRISSHIFFVATTALLIARYLQAKTVTLRIKMDDQWRDVEAKSLDMGKLLQIALVHDWGEAFLGDVDRGVKASLLQLAGVDINDLEVRLLSRLLGKSGAFDELIEYHREYENWASAEALVVRVADLVDHTAAESRRFSGSDTRLTGATGGPIKLPRLRERCPQLADVFQAFKDQWTSVPRRI